MIDRHAQFHRFLQRNLALDAASFHGVPVPGMVYHDVAKLARGHGQKMAAVLPIHRLAGKEFQVKFVDQSSGLKGVIRALNLKVMSRQAAELLVYDANQLPAGIVIPRPPSL